MFVCSKATKKFPIPSSQQFDYFLITPLQQQLQSRVFIHLLITPLQQLQSKVFIRLIALIFQLDVWSISFVLFEFEAKKFAVICQAEEGR